MRTRPSSELTLHDRLSRLDFVEATKLLQPDGARLLSEGGKMEIDVTTQLHFTADMFQVTFPEAAPDNGPVVVSLSVHPGHKKRLRMACSHSDDLARKHLGAVLSLILEEKMALGLAEAPVNLDVPWELLPESELERRALAEREKRAAEEKMRIAPERAGRGNAGPWTDYIVTNAASGKSYRLTLRGMERGMSYCSCPDFRKNQLGTCKHMIKVQV